MTLTVVMAHVLCAECFPPTYLCGTPRATEEVFAAERAGEAEQPCAVCFSAANVRCRNCGAIIRRASDTLPADENPLFAENMYGFYLDRHAAMPDSTPLGLESRIHFARKAVKVAGSRAEANHARTLLKDARKLLAEIHGEISWRERIARWFE